MAAPYPEHPKAAGQLFSPNLSDGSSGFDRERQKSGRRRLTTRSPGAAAQVMWSSRRSLRHGPTQTKESGLAYMTKGAVYDPILGLGKEQGVAPYLPR